MKINFKNRRTVFFALFMAVFSLSCSKDEEPGNPQPEPIGSELSGILEQDLTLDPETAYTLTGSFIVKDGYTLSIPAGTKITAQKGENVYIAVEQGAKIFVQGTQTAPVLMTSVNGAAGDWGGLLLLGRARTTAGIAVIAEVGGFIYGGTDNTDSSGSISYLIIEGAGSQINSESQFNGLSLYSVGSGTSISNVAILDGADDGVEFFGGTVSVENLYLENNEDDAVDWTEGWNGMITNTFVNHSIEGFSTAIEADGINSMPEIINFTAVSTTGGIALQFKKESGASIQGFSLSGYDTTLDMADNGALSNIIIEGEIADPSKNYGASPTVMEESFSWAME